jgi:hypothetical protein
MAAKCYEKSLEMDADFEEADKALRRLREDG